MMGGYDFGWGGMFLMSFGMILWIALLFVLTWALIRWIDRRTPGSTSPGTGAPSNGPSALEILRQRYARGEIDTTTFEQMRERLGHTQVPSYQQSDEKLPTMNGR